VDVLCYFITYFLDIPPFLEINKVDHNELFNIEFFESNYDNCTPIIIYIFLYKYILRNDNILGIRTFSI